MPTRARWGSYDPIDVARAVDRTVMAHAFALLFGTGGTLVLVTAALSSTDRLRFGLAAPALAAYGVVAVMLAKPRLLSEQAFAALPAFGAVLVSMVAYSAGNSTFNAYALLYVWVILSAFYFFPARQAAISLALVGAGYGVVLLHHDGADERLLYFVMGFGTLVVGSLMLALLRDRIERLLRALQQSDLLKTTILRSVSHDLRTPLTAIMAAGESSASPQLDQATRAEVASVIVDEAGRLSEMVENLLDVSRLEAGTAVPRQTWCSVEELVEASLEHVPDRAVDFNVSAEEGLPGVWADAAQLERAFTNLFENAGRFGGGRVDVNLSKRRGRLVMRVVDRGPGVDEPERERIFEPFYRVVADGGVHRGPGLGLAIVKGFIEGNGGSVRVESSPAGGAAFVVEFPTG